VSVVIFTHHNSVLADVSAMLRKELGMTVFEVSRTTDPARRHTALRSFQAGATATATATATTTAAAATTATAAAAATPSDRGAASNNGRAASSSSVQGARAFCTTFATAAVGLTLTAASRVYLLEASLDPAQEAQAAGRIHRLGQTKEVLVRRFYFKVRTPASQPASHQTSKSGLGERWRRGTVQRARRSS
jgi:long-subunit fatty acid transport protein